MNRIHSKCSQVSTVGFLCGMLLILCNIMMLAISQYVGMFWRCMYSNITDGGIALRLLGSCRTGSNRSKVQRLDRKHVRLRSRK